MPVIAMSWGGVADIAIASIWAIAAATYWMAAYRHSVSVSDALRPVRLFGMWLSLSWCAWYIILFADVFEGKRIWLHGINDGLLLVTATYLILISATSTRTLKKLGIK